MTHYELNDCTNLLNIIEIMNSLTVEDQPARSVMQLYLSDSVLSLL